MWLPSNRHLHQHIWYKTDARERKKFAEDSSPDPEAMLAPTGLHLEGLQAREHPGLREGQGQGDAGGLWAVHRRHRGAPSHPRWHTRLHGSRGVHQSWALSKHVSLVIMLSPDSLTACMLICLWRELYFPGCWTLRLNRVHNDKL